MPAKQPNVPDSPSQLTAESLEKKIRSHPLFSSRPTNTAPTLPPIVTNQEPPQPFRLSTGWLVATTVVCLLGMALVLLAYLNAD